MEQIEISNKEYERIKGKGIEITDIHGAKFVIIGDVAFRRSIIAEDVADGYKEESSQTI
jgi:hypothetical protein